MASVCDDLGHGRVVTIDVLERPGRPATPPGVTYLTSAVDGRRGAGARSPPCARRAARVMVIHLDHTRDHVSRELKLDAPLVTPGCYLVVEDTINLHPVAPEFGPGPMEAVEAFLETTESFEIDRSREKLLLSFNPSGYLKTRLAASP